MGCFSNGTEGMMYEAEYCNNCVHLHPEYGCPCLEAHSIWNYDECNNKDSILHKMIPMAIKDLKLKNGQTIKDFPYNEQCIFFVKHVEFC